MAQIGPDGELLSNNEFLLPDGTVLKYVHKPSQCDGPHCVIHNPSDHAMRTFPLNWREDTRVMERICPHGIGHPDPDHLTWDSRSWAGVHGCDGCCGGAHEPVDVPAIKRVIALVEVALEIPADMIVDAGGNFLSATHGLLLPSFSILVEATDKIVGTEIELQDTYGIRLVDYVRTETVTDDL